MISQILRLLLPFAGILAVIPVAQADSGFQAAGSSEHAWFLLPSPETAEDGLTWSLAHSGQRDEPNIFRLLRRFQERPTAMAAHDDHLWLMLAPHSTRPQQVSVRVLRVEWDPRIDRYAPVPRTGLDILPDLPVAGPGPVRPLGLVATSGGPVALVDEGDAAPRLHRLVRGGWTELSLPPDLSDHLQLGTAGDQLVLLEHTPDMLRQWRWVADDWVAATPLMLDAATVKTAATDDQLLAMTDDSGGDRRLLFIQPEGPVQLGQVPSGPAGASFCPLGVAGRVSVAMFHEDSLSEMSINPLTGEATDWTLQELGSPLSMSLWPVLIAFTSSAVVLVILLRGRLLPLPEGYGPLSPLPRFAALVIDAIPAIVIVGLWRGIEPRILMEAMMLTLDIQQWFTYGWIILITGGWSLLGEAILGFSPGKALVGGRLICEDGRRPGVGRCVVRTILKMMVLLLPILAVTALRPPSLQSVADQASRVMVATKRPLPPPS